MNAAAIVARNEAIIRDFDGGRPIDQIASEHEIGMYYVRGIIKASGRVVPRNRMRPRDPDARAIRMMEMYRSGLTLVKIGERYQLTRERVRQILRKFGCLRHEGGQSKKARDKRRHSRATRDARSLAMRGLPHAQWKELIQLGVTKAFSQQRKSARSRGIEWRLTLAEWWEVWQKSGHWPERGIGANRYCMARISDDGCYEVGNVYVTTCRENGQEYQARRKRVGNKGLTPFTGVTLLYPGNKKPYVAKCGRKYIGYFEHPEEAVAARQAYLSEAAS